MKPEILYEDNHLLVVVKPAGMLSQSDRTGKTDLLSYLKAYLKEKYQKPGAVYLGLVHRLDQPTGGILVFARTSKAAARLQAQMKAGEMKKEYLAVCSAGLAPAGEMEDWLWKDANENKALPATPQTPGAKWAKLFYRVLGERGGLALAAVQLQTGRQHQIRAQFALRGHPLFGDQKYGSCQPGPLGLFAWRLSFLHPTKKEKMQFSALPKAPPFDKFLLQTKKNMI